MPADNPMPGQGGRLWLHEMGPRGGGELNLIEQSRNYGWPVVSNGNEYNGSTIPDHDTRPEFAAPAIYWRPVIASVALPGLAAGQGRDPASQEPTDMRINVMFGGMTMAVMLYDNPSARDLYSMLPLHGTIQDYSNNEKIVYLPRRLTQDGSGRFGNENGPGDLCYYAPWGDLVLYYAGYRYSNGLIPLGRVEEGFERLLTRGEFPVRIEQIAS